MRGEVAVNVDEHTRAVRAMLAASPERVEVRGYEMGVIMRAMWGHIAARMLAYKIGGEGVEQVPIYGFGVFVAGTTKPKKIRNPRNGVVRIYPAHRRVRFVPHPDLVRAVN